MRFRILSYNIHRAIGVDRRFRPERVVSIIENHDPDLVLLQEVDEDAPRSRQMDLARELARALGYAHFAVGHNVTLRQGRYGNATLSRHPIQHARNLHLPGGGPTRRGCQHTAIALESGGGHRHRLEVFNLHLGLSAGERERQVGLLVRSREFTLLPEAVPCLVAGDFNDWRSRLQPIFTGLLAFRSATERGFTGERGIPTYPSFFPRGALDRIYYRGPLRLLAARRCRLKVSRVASDHLPIVADFEVH
jgi:endonuclease/exonuclease/phosphatase family metal-dependent hydrolase